MSTTQKTLEEVARVLGDLPAKLGLASLYEKVLDALAVAKDPADFALKPKAVADDTLRKKILAAKQKERRLKKKAQETKALALGSDAKTA